MRATELIRATVKEGRYVDLSQVRDELESKYEWNNIECEGSESMRFDMDVGTIHVGETGKIDGLDEFPRDMQEDIRGIVTRAGNSYYEI